MKKPYGYNAAPVIILLLLFIGVLLAEAAENQTESVTLKGKEAMYGGLGQNNSFPVLNVHPENSQCFEECIRHNQMAAVGFEVIQEQCRQKCELDTVLSLLKSREKVAYEKGVKALCETHNSRSVPPLIIALKRDLKERTGLWAWIIPALGASQDQRAVPVLTETLTIMDEDWLGREMSARTLGSLGDQSSIPYLLAAAWRADTRDAAIQALAQFHDERVLPVLLSALDPDEEPQTREAAITGLHKLGSMAVPEIMAAFSDFSPEHPDTQKRLWLCQLLGTSGDERALKMLLDSINDPDTTVGKCAKEYVHIP